MCVSNVRSIPRPIVRKQPNKNKHHFRIGFTGRAKNTQQMVSGRIDILGNTHMHAEYRIKEFFKNDFEELELYGTHLVYDGAA